jgi:hypothetical protein
MNTNASSSASANAAARATRDGTRHTDPHTLRREGDRFERLLREKSAPRDDEDDAQPGLPNAECAAPPLPAPPSGLGQPLQGHVAEAVAAARAGAAAGDTPTRTQAALGAAMSAQAPAPAQANGADAHTFEVSIGEPMGLPLELRAVRVPAAGNVQAPALWALNIAAPSRDSGPLSRHGSRLDDRLRARGIDSTRVRIDDRPDPEETS